MAHDNEGTQNKVGYRNPPVEYRFKKGESGNPSGRPRQVRRDKSYAEMLEQILSEKMTVTINGKKKRLSVEEAVLHKYVNHMLLNGDFLGLDSLKQSLSRRNWR